MSHPWDSFNALAWDRLDARHRQLTQIQSQEQGHKKLQFQSQMAEVGQRETHEVNVQEELILVKAVEVKVLHFGETVHDFFKKVERRERTHKPSKEFCLWGLDAVKFQEKLIIQ